VRQFLYIAPLAAIALTGCLSGNDASDIDAAPPLAGGDLTLFDGTSGAFSSPAPGLSEQDSLQHSRGDARFGATFVTAPALTNPGLGPLFNNVSCVSCHLGDGRGRPPASGEALSSMLFRISATGQDEHGGPKPMPGYGGQLQTRATFGNMPEVSIAFEYRDSVVVLAGGDTATLRVPKYTLQNPWKPFSETPLISPRVAPPVFGLGLLEAVDETELLSRSDPDDARDGDGISGRPNHVYDAVKGVKVVGRFGWKANNPDLQQQSAGAFNQDMGITTPVFPGENCAGDRPECASHPAEVDSVALESVVFYLRTLAVPGRRNWSASQVVRGEKLFENLGCAACHSPESHTGNVSGHPELSGQTIHAYTDLLLHDMGTGLADGRPDYEASGSEWRTTPLWGIGLTEVVNGHSFFLHDGRARSMLEAVLWHAGEAEKAKNAVRQASHDDREALLAFLESL
jgi:CxxC motif-containing protein (DUF1111 family)